MVSYRSILLKILKELAQHLNIPDETENKKRKLSSPKMKSTKVQLPVKRNWPDREQLQDPKVSPVFLKRNNFK
ncbi:hypothetical protein DMN91_012668 [Ooceraea biroi]|uniref:Uncharacterized protein n=1 Tax=Ooceraea biroi TaxID=2015173 RepID=A0A3L8D3R7_OOCBI|nr:hypothetical protein DMN91_012668 [Ooceraea biroi]